MYFFGRWSWIGSNWERQRWVLDSIIWPSLEQYRLWFSSSFNVQKMFFSLSTIRWIEINAKMKVVNKIWMMKRKRMKKMAASLGKKTADLSICMKYTCEQRKFFPIIYIKIYILMGGWRKVLFWLTDEHRTKWLEAYSELKGIFVPTALNATLTI